jgi:2,3-bisphosphoglycerate-independent phosphoglycerate mutase
MAAGILFLFVDGVGLATANAANPLATLPTPALRALLGGPLTAEQVQDKPQVLLRALDASLGVPGKPQSATGQTALFTGQNGAALLGHHVTAFPGPQLKALIAAHSLFKRVRDAGRTATFANPYGAAYLARVRAGAVRASVTTCAVEAAGLRFRDGNDLERGEAVTWDIVGDYFATRAEMPVAVTTPRQAGERLARLARQHDLVVWETFLTDLAAHQRFGMRVDDAVERVDGLLAGCLADLDPTTTLVLCSDHGNLEDGSHLLHTTNPVPLLAVGPQAVAFRNLESILDLSPAILEAMGIRPT